MSTHDQDGVKRRTRAQQVALFRYQLICPALDPDLSTKARGKIVRAIAAGTHAARSITSPATRSQADGGTPTARRTPRC